MKNQEPITPEVIESGEYKLNESETYFVEYFEERADELNNRLNALDREFTVWFSRTKQQKNIPAHWTFDKDKRCFRSPTKPEEDEKDAVQEETKEEKEVQEEVEQVVEENNGESSQVDGENTPNTTME